MIYVCFVITILLIIPSIILLIEVTSALYCGNVNHSQGMLGQQSKDDFFVLIPAQNEEDLIELTIKSLLPQVDCARQIIVVADNCDDATAELALKHGVQVFERKDQTKRGKGYALDYGIKKRGPHKNYLLRRVIL